MGPDVWVLAWQIDEPDTQTAVTRAARRFVERFGYKPTWIYVNPATGKFTAPPGAARVEDRRVPQGLLYLGDIRQKGGDAIG